MMDEGAKGSCPDVCGGEAWALGGERRYARSMGQLRAVGHAWGRLR